MEMEQTSLGWNVSLDSDEKNMVCKWPMLFSFAVEDSYMGLAFLVYRVSSYTNMIDYHLISFPSLQPLKLPILGLKFSLFIFHTCLSQRDQPCPPYLSGVLYPLSSPMLRSLISFRTFIPVCNYSCVSFSLTQLLHLTVM